MANEPKHVRLAERLQGRVFYDVNSGWSISGNDVKPYPEGRAARQFVRSRLNQGILEPASVAEAEEIQERNDESLQARRERMEQGLGPAIPYQEGAVRAQVAEAVEERRARSKSKREEEGDESQVEETDDDNYPSMTNDDLREELRSRDLDTSGNKAALVSRLREDDAQG